MSDLFPTRRLVVATGLALASAPSVQGAITASMPAGLCLYDTRIPASRAFARGFDGHAASSDPDIIRTLRDALKLVAPQQIVGLVGWAHFLLVRDALRESGYRMEQRFEHHVHARGAKHRMQVNGRWRDVLLPDVNWPTMLGRSFRTHESPLVAPRTGMSQAPQSSALLVSWTAARESDQRPPQRQHEALIV